METIWLTPHWRVTLPPSSFCMFSSSRNNHNHSFVPSLWWGAQLLIFASSVLHQLRKSLIIQAIFPSDKRVPRSTRWNKKIAQQQEAVQPQQIQALLANVEELTHQNEKLRKTMESQNAERRQTGENQNEEESNS